MNKLPAIITEPMQYWAVSVIGWSEEDKLNVDKYLAMLPREDNVENHLPNES